MLARRRREAHSIVVVDIVVVLVVYDTLQPPHRRRTTKQFLSEKANFETKINFFKLFVLRVRVKVHLIKDVCFFLYQQFAIHSMNTINISQLLNNVVLFVVGFFWVFLKKEIEILVH